MSEFEFLKEREKGVPKSAKILVKYVLEGMDMAYNKAINDAIVIVQASSPGNEELASSIISSLRKLKREKL